MTFPKLPFGSTKFSFGSSPTKFPYSSTKSPFGSHDLLELPYGCSYMATKGSLGPTSKAQEFFNMGKVEPYSIPTKDIFIGTLPAGGNHYQLLPKLDTFTYHEGIGGIPSETKLTPP